MSTLQPRRCTHTDIEPGTRHVPLTRGMCAIVDEADYDWLMQWKWFAASWSGQFYAVRHDYATGRDRNVIMHRELMAVYPPYYVDHIDGNGLNNRRANLRPCTNSQNQANRKGKRGVHFRDGKYIAYITINRKRKHLGQFPTLEDALAVRQKAAKEHFGEFYNER